MGIFFGFSWFVYNIHGKIDHKNLLLSFFLLEKKLEKIFVLRNNENYKENLDNVENLYKERKKTH